MSGTRSYKDLTLRSLATLREVAPRSSPAAARSDTARRPATRVLQPTLVQVSVRVTGVPSQDAVSRLITRASPSTVIERDSTLPTLA
jgi:hypothetical protein